MKDDQNRKRGVAVYIAPVHNGVKRNQVQSRGKLPHEIPCDWFILSKVNLDIKHTLDKGENGSHHEFKLTYS